MSDSPIKRGIPEKEFLNNYIRFAAVHRWTVAKTCLGRWKTLDGSSPERAHLALEILFCYLLLMEDTLMWHHVLKKLQQSSSDHLMDILNRVNLRPESRSAAVEEMKNMSDQEFMTLLGFSGAVSVPQLGLSAEQYQAVRQEIVNLKQMLTVGIDSFLHGNSGVFREGTLVKCLNKVKHGLLVMRMRDAQDQPEYVGVFPEGTGLDFATDRSSLPSIPSQENSLQTVCDETRNLTRALVGMLTVLFLTRFKDRPGGTPPDELV